MSDASDPDNERAAIREEKIEQLRKGAEQGGMSPSGTPDEPVHVTGHDHLQELLEENRVVLVDFYADWCGPCKMLEPTVERVAAETEAAVVKVDIDAHQKIAGQYQVQGVPTLYLFVDGQATERMVGVQDEGTLTNLVSQHT